MCGGGEEGKDLKHAPETAEQRLVVEDEHGVARRDEDGQTRDGGAHVRRVHAALVDPEQGPAAVRLPEASAPLLEGVPLRRGVGLPTVKASTHSAFLIIVLSTFPDLQPEGVRA